MVKERPSKKLDREVWSLISEKIVSGDYVFLNHAKKRLKDRNITDVEVLNILESKVGKKRKRNKAKDSFDMNHGNWKYCIEGQNNDEQKIRVIISFDSNYMLIITVIRLDN